MIPQQSSHTGSEVIDNRALGEGLFNPFSYNFAKISSHTRHASILPPLKAKHIRLALICLDMPTDDIIPEKTSSCPKDENIIDKDSLTRQLFHLKDPHIQFDYYKYALLKAANDYKANIICLNELGFPTENGEPSPKAVEFTKNLAAKHSCIVVAGSYHDSRTFYNSGHAYFPQEDNIPFCYYHKQVSAKAIKYPELVSIPPNRRSISITGFGINIGVVICLDLLDFSAIAPLIEPKNKVNLILVPSFTDNIKPLEFVAADLSKVLPGGVVIVNRREIGKEEDPIRAYFFGEQLKYSSKLSRSPNYKAFWLKGKKGRIIIHDINFNQFCRDIQLKSNDYDPYLRWLFGIPTPQIRQPNPQVGISLNTSDPGENSELA
jgi:hypothetical protein